VALAPYYPTVVCIEALDVQRAGALVQALIRSFDAEDVSLDGDSLEVCVQTRGDSSEAVLRIVETIESWLAPAGLGSTQIHFEGLSYRIATPRKAAAAQ
jgi:hypothetical protein